MSLLQNLRTMRLDNGMAVYVLPRSGQAAVEIECHVRTGSIHEQEFLGCGLSHFLEHMLFQGCCSYPGTAAADAINALGGDINAYTGFDRTVYYCEVAAADWRKGTDVLAKMVMSPEFPAERFAAESKVICRECELGRDNPDRRLLERLWELRFAAHPMRLPIIGYPDKVKSVTRKMMSEYYKRRYAPNRTFWVIVGDVVPEECFALLHELTGNWPVGRLDEPFLPPEKSVATVRELDCEFADPLSRLACGWLIPGIDHQDIAPLDVAAGLIGMSDASRLVRKLRMESELAVNTECFAYAIGGGGIMATLATGTPRRIKRCEKELRSEMLKIYRDGFSSAEVKREKNQEEAEFLRQLRSNGGIANAISSGIYAADAPLFSEQYRRTLAGLTADDVNEVVHKYLSPECCVTVRQSPEGTFSGAGRRSNVPETAPLSVEQLPCGARLVYRGDAEVELVDIFVVMPGGALWEKSGQRGVSLLLSNMLSCGCRSYSEAAFAEELEKIGAVLSISGGNNTLTIKGNVHKKHAMRLVDLLGRMLHAPTFGAKEFAREKNNALENFASRMEQPQFAAGKLCAGMIFGQHPYAGGTSGLAEDIAALTADDLAAFYHDICTPDFTVLAFGGALSAEQAVDLGGKLATYIPWNGRQGVVPPYATYPQSSDRAEINLPKEQAVVMYALPGCDCLSDDMLSCNVLCDAMNGLSSRLFKTIREEHALAYTVGMRQMSGFCGGMLTFFAVTAPKNAEQALKLLRQEVRRLAESGLAAAELAEARRGAALALERNNAEPGSALFSAALAIFYGEPITAPQDDAVKIRNLSDDEINSMLRRYLSSDAGQIVIAGGIDGESKEK